MNGLLIYPRFPDTFWSFKHALKFIHKRAALPRRGVRRIYAPRTYYARVRTFLREFRPKRFSRQTRCRDLFAFANACVRLGVLGRERFQFWALLVWTFFRRPRLLPVAITLSIYGHHFRLCSRRA